MAFDLTSRIRTGALLCSLALVATGCNSNTKQSASIDNVDLLVSHVERVHLEAELSKQAVYDALLKMQPMFARNFEGDPAEAFQTFAEATDNAVAQAVVFRSQVDPMSKSASDVFRNWSESLLDFNSPNLRARSAKRLEATRDRFAEVEESAKLALETFEKLNARMQDTVLFLGNDFNQDSIEAMAEDAIALRTDARELSADLDDCMELAVDYVNKSALRGQTQPSIEVQVEAGTDG